MSYVRRHSLAVVAWHFSGNPEHRNAQKALKLAHKSAHAGSVYGHHVLYELWRDENRALAIQHLELACSREERMLSDCCFLCAS